MFDMEIIDTDLFLDMPIGAQNLYFHLGMRADDDGFVSNPRKIQKLIGANEDDLRILIAKQFIIPFDTGIIVIRHWKLNNYLRKDRYTPTIYTQEKALLQEDSNGVYSLGIPVGIPDGNQMTTIGIHSIEENSIEKNSIEESIDAKVKNTRFKKPTIDEVRAYCTERKNNIDAEHFIDYYESNGWKVGKNSMKDWKATVRNWEKRNGTTQKTSASKYTTEELDVLLEKETSNETKKAIEEAYAKGEII